MKMIVCHQVNTRAASEPKRACRENRSVRKPGKWNRDVSWEVRVKKGI